MIQSTRSDDPADDPTGVHALLRSLPSPGPMPAELVDRISESLRTEVMSQVAASDSVTPLWAVKSRRGLSSRFVLGFAATAAAAAVVGSFGVNALLNSSSTERAIADGAARLGGVHMSSDLRIYHSETAYTSANLMSTARALASGSTTATLLATYASEAPSLGPIATPIGIGACLTSLGVSDSATVVDLATYDGVPAAIIVTAHVPTPQVLAVRRECGGSSSASTLLSGPIALP